MTVQETILSFPGLSEFPANHLPAILHSRNLIVAADVSEVEIPSLNLAIADVLVFAVNMPDFTENKLSISYPRKYFIETARLLYSANGEENRANSLIKRISVPRGYASNKW